MFTAFHVFIIPYFYRFWIFFSKKSVNLFIVNSCKALILLAFLFCQNWLEVHRLFYRIFNNLCLIKEKAPVLSQKLKPLLNISITPAIRPSPYIHALHLYSATRKISLSFGERPLTSYPGLRPSLHRNGYLQISPSIQIFPQLFLPYGYFHRLLPL